MKLTDIVVREAIIESLEARDKKSAIKELVEVIKSTRKPTGFKLYDVVEAVLKREKVGTTGMGGGIAIPHAKLDGLTTLVGAFGRSREGIDFNAVDGEKVHLVFLIVSPFQEANLHLEALKRINAAVRTPNVAKFLRAARSAREIFDLFREVDETNAA